MAQTVYILCAVLSFSCAAMLYRGYLKNRFRLLFWSSWGFAGFAVNNTLLFLDLIIVPGHDLSVIRTLPALVGMITLVYGLITDTV